MVFMVKKGLPGKYEIEWRSVEGLIPYARNSRTHSKDQVAQIAASIREFGWTNPILVDGDGTIIAGHGRVMAAQKLGETEVPCIELGHLTEAQKRAYVIADNQLALNAGWDAEMLKVEIAELVDADFDLGLLGFDDAMLAGLMGVETEGLTDPDDVPEPPAVPVTALGDVWMMGRHRIICGSSTEADTVAKLLLDVKPHLMVTDPPYGVEYDASWRDKELGGKSGGRATGTVKNDDKADWREAWALFPGDVAYVWTSGKFVPESILSLEAVGFQRRCLIIWAKSQFVIGRGDYHSQEEECWYAVRKGKPGQYEGGRKQSTIWQIDKPRKSETGHSTQKPIECMKRPIENNSSPGQAIYEPFSGSGTTIIAGEMTGRHIYAVELNPAYVDVAVKRWQDFTGQQAILDGDGRTFDEIAGTRLQKAAE
jgi:DNA modification methylase